MKRMLVLIIGVLIIGSSHALQQETMNMHRVEVRNYYTGDLMVPSYDRSSNVYVVVHNDDKERTDKFGIIVHEPQEMKDVSVSVVVYDLGLRYKSKSSRIKHDDTQGFNVPVFLPEETEPGEYWMRITTSNDDYRRVKHRPIVVW